MLHLKLLKSIEICGCHLQKDFYLVGWSSVYNNGTEMLKMTHGLFFSVCQICVNACTLSCVRMFLCQPGSVNLV